MKPRDFGLLYPSVWLFGQFFLVWFLAIPIGLRLLAMGAKAGIPGMKEALAWATFR